MKMNKLTKVLVLVSIFFSAGNNQLSAKSSAIIDEQLEQKIEKILKELTIEEKVDLCSGGGAGYKGISRLDIPTVGLCDGPRGPNGQVGTTAFPCGVLFGSTWNPEIVEKAGKVMGEETRALGRGMLLGPGCNIQRDPLGGRFFEYYTEDPCLNSAITVAHIKGIQSEGTSACLKHYCCNNREDNRNFYMSMVDDRTLHEIYLPAFKAAVQDANVWAIMTSANGVNKEFVSDSKKMLNDILKEKWGFSGFVLTDWLQTRSVEKAALAGLDVSMPGGNCGFAAPLLEAVKAGRVPENVIDDKVRRILRVYGRIGILDNKDLKKGATINTKEHQAVPLAIAKEGIVLLQNKNNNLPFDKKEIKKILVTGPNANRRFCLLAMGGSSWVESPYEITALQGIKNTLGDSKVEYISSDDLGGFTLIPNDAMKTEKGEIGFRAQYFVKGKDEPVLVKVVPNVDFMWEMKSPDPSIKLEDFREARFDAQIMPPADGKYTFKFIAGGGNVTVFNNEWQGAPIALADKDRGNGTATATVDLKKGVPYHLCAIYAKQTGDAAFRIEWEMPETSDKQFKWTELDRAAKEADAVIFVGGLDNSLDTEGRDRVSLTFPGIQEKMINHLAGINKRLSVVLINGSPLELGGWRTNVPSILEAWYPGMEGGTAIANVLFGDVNPSGRLPFTWPKKLEDSPSQKLATQDNDFVNYTEKLMVGYRYYDTKNVEPEFAFGYGLGYTEFTYKKLILKKSKDNSVNGSVLVKNTGKRDGTEVVQIYVKPLAPSVDRPVHELKAFKKVFVKAGETINVDFTLKQDDFSYFNVNINDWSFDAGKYEIQAGRNSRDILVSSKITM